MIVRVRDEAAGMRTDRIETLDGVVFANQVDRANGLVGFAIPGVGEIGDHRHLNGRAVRRQRLDRRDAEKSPPPLVPLSSPTAHRIEQDERPRAERKQGDDGADRSRRQRGAQESTPFVHGGNTVPHFVRRARLGRRRDRFVHDRIFRV